MNRIRLILSWLAFYALLASSNVAHGQAVNMPKPTSCYVLFCDLTTSNNIVRDGKVCNLIPGMVMETLLALLRLNPNQEFSVSIRAITNDSYSEEYVLSHRFNGPEEGPAQQARFLNSLKPRIKNWIISYQKKQLEGTDIYSCLSKLSILERGLPLDQPVTAIFYSDLIHEKAKVPAQPHFVRPTQIFVLYSNNTGKPALVEQSLQKFVKMVTNANGTADLVADTGVLERLLKSGGRTAAP